MLVFGCETVLGCGSGGSSLCPRTVRCGLLGRGVFRYRIFSLTTLFWGSEWFSSVTGYWRALAAQMDEFELLNGVIVVSLFSFHTMWSPNDLFLNNHKIRLTKTTVRVSSRKWLMLISIYTTLDMYFYALESANYNLYNLKKCTAQEF